MDEHRRAGCLRDAVIGQWCGDFRQIMLPSMSKINELAGLRRQLLERRVDIPIVLGLIAPKDANVIHEVDDSC